MKEALHDVPLIWEFTQLSWDQRLPDESTILRFRDLLEKHKLAEQILVIVGDMFVGEGLLLNAGTAVDATLIAAPSSSKNSSGHVAMRPGKRRALDKNKLLDQLTDKIEKTKASIRAEVERPFRVIKLQFGHVKIRYRGLAKNTAQLQTLFALSNLWQAREKLLVLDGQARLKTA